MADSGINSKIRLGGDVSRGVVLWTFCYSSMFLAKPFEGQIMIRSIRDTRPCTRIAARVLHNPIEYFFLNYDYPGIVALSSQD